MEFTDQKNTLDSAGKLLKSIRDISSAVMVDELFESFPFKSDIDVIQEQLEKGRPLFTPERVKIKAGSAEKVFELLIDAFLVHLSEKAEDWEKLEQNYRSGEISASGLLEATLRHRWGTLQNWTQKFSLDIDALQFFSLNLARPFRQQAAERLWNKDYNPIWRKGYCPVCGHSPVLSCLVGDPQIRQLWCCCCNTTWDFTRIGCPFCLNQAQNHLGYLTVKEFPGYRIYTCDNCKRYLKTGVCPDDSSKEAWDYHRGYFSTTELDPIALQEGYIAEPVWLARCEPSP
jgi:FdhE protein